MYVLSKGVRSYRTRYVGSDMGLIAILNTTHDDDTASLLNIDGYVVMIHAPNNFADISSGNAIEIFPMNNEETFLAIKARSMDTEEGLRTFSPHHVISNDIYGYVRTILHIKFNLFEFHI